MRVNASLASFAGLSVDDAVLRAMSGVREPWCGDLVLDVIQVCPQNRSVVSAESVAGWRRKFGREIRLHANVRVTEGRAIAIDAIDALGDGIDYFRAIGPAVRAGGSGLYTLHPGSRMSGSRDQLIGAVEAIEDEVGVEVALEGMYPGRGELLDSAEDYRWLLESGIPYVLDVSHMHILRERVGLDDGLFIDLLASEQLKEIHTSGNDGYADKHHVPEGELWWMEAVRKYGGEAVVFSESNRMRRG